jgi:hypothetical protein
MSSGRDPEVDHRADPLGTPLGVGEREGAAPGAPKYQPLVDLEVLPQPLHVSEQMVGRVAGEVRLQCTGVGYAAPAIALIEEQEAIGSGIEELAVPRGTARAGAAVHYDSWLPVRVAAELPVDALAVPPRPRARARTARSLDTRRLCPLCRLLPPSSACSTARTAGGGEVDAVHHIGGDLPPPC